jgi:D-sedoheptulose 7-phosphate isomerase
MEKFLKDYAGRVKQCLDDLPLAELERAVNALEEAVRGGKQIFAFGNGACAAASSHFVCDLVKGCIVEGAPRVKAFCLNDGAPLMTAWANDDSYERVFVEPLKNYLEAGDVVMALSASGNSPNVLRAAEYGREAGAVVVGLTGKGGGKLAELAEIPIVVKSPSYEEVEDIHVVVTHMLKLALIRKLKSSN